MNGRLLSGSVHLRKMWISHVGGLFIHGERLVAFTGHGCEFLAIDDAQLSASTANCACFLHLRGQDADARAPRTETMRNSLLRYLNHIRAKPVGEQEQPDGKSLLQPMQHGTRSSLFNLPHIIARVS